MKFSVILSNLGSCSDRYMQNGYHTPYSLQELFERLGEIDGVDGVELIGGSHASDENIEFLKKETSRLKIPVVAIIPDHFGRKVWSCGAYTSPEESVRKLAVEETNKMAELARELSCKTISIWNGQDGYDYPLQANYIDAQKWLVEGIKQSAKKYPDITFALEYKPKEPRNHSFISNAWSAAMFASETECDNVGVTIDVGHSFEAYENVSESICTLVSRNKLKHFHINDNNRLWDDDMITGSVHTIEFIEMFWWLKKLGYNGYISIDQYPYREDSLKAAQESIYWMQTFERAADRIDTNKMDSILANNDAVSSTKYMRELIFG